MLTFADEETWLGGFYELAIEVGARDDHRLRTVLRSIWSNTAMLGAFLRRDLDFTAQSPVAIEALPLDGHLYGMATLAPEQALPCGTVTIRLDDGIDWISFYLPIGSLTNAYRTGTAPFELVTRGQHRPTWQDHVDVFLLEMARCVDAAVNYRFGLIGLEVCADTTFEELTANGLPADRRAGYIWNQGSGLCYFPPT